jgi:hypothetical protein
MKVFPESVVCTKLYICVFISFGNKVQLFLLGHPSLFPIWILYRWNVLCSCNYAPSISKSTNEVLNVQGVWHFPNTLPTMDHGQTFRTITYQSLSRGPISTIWRRGRQPCGFELWQSSSHPNINFFIFTIIQYNIMSYTAIYCHIII